MDAHCCLCLLPGRHVDKRRPQKVLRQCLKGVLLGSTSPRRPRLSVCGFKRLPARRLARLRISRCKALPDALATEWLPLAASAAIGKVAIVVSKRQLASFKVQIASRRLCLRVLADQEQWLPGCAGSYTSWTLHVSTHCDPPADTLARQLWLFAFPISSL